ncbi:uncharacterized protein LOC141651207 [Silene latifolia]|uniref:uncharacterized protein LOC141651207 n=1 Tax=Silene latifolia TaxID=37657 RepID=UPI003D774549
MYVYILQAVNKRPVILADPNRIEKPHVRVGRGLVENKSAAAETVVHGEKLLPNHRIVEITTVNPGHENFQLPVPVRDDITILGDALGSFIQWPDTHIYLAKISPPPEQRKAVGGTKKAALADKPKSTDMPTTSTSQQLDEGTKSKTHSFPDLKVRTLNSTQYKGKDYMQKVRTVTMKRLHEEAGHRIATEQLITVDVQHIFVWMK